MHIGYDFESQLRERPLQRRIILKYGSPKTKQTLSFLHNSTLPCVVDYLFAISHMKRAISRFSAFKEPTVRYTRPVLWGPIAAAVNSTRTYLSCGKRITAPSTLSPRIVGGQIRLSSQDQRPISVAVYFCCRNKDPVELA